MALNWSNALKQGLSGAAGGAGLGALGGSTVPGIGTGLGAGAGGALGFLTAALQGLMTSPEEQSGFEQAPSRFSPQQQEAMNKSLTQGLSNLQNPTAGFEPIEKYANTQFQSNIVPGLAERFLTLGGGHSSRNSSGFINRLSGAGSELQQGLAAMKAQYGLANQSNALQQLQLGLNPQHELIYFGRQPGVGQQLYSNASNLIGDYFKSGGQVGGPVSNNGQLQLSQEQASKLLQLLKLLQGR